MRGVAQGPRRRRHLHFATDGAPGRQLRDQGGPRPVAGTRTTAPDGVPGGGNIAFDVPAAGSTWCSSYDLATHVLTVSTRAAGATPDLTQAKAQWLRADLVAWDVPDAGHAALPPALVARPATWPSTPRPSPVAPRVPLTPRPGRAAGRRAGRLPAPRGLRGVPAATAATSRQVRGDPARPARRRVVRRRRRALRRHRGAGPRRPRRRLRRRRRPRARRHLAGPAPDAVAVWAPTAQDVDLRSGRRRAPRAPCAMGRHGDGDLVGDRAAVVEGSGLPLRGRGLGARRPGGRHQPGHRPLLGRADDQLRRGRCRRPRRPGARAAGLVRATAAAGSRSPRTAPSTSCTSATSPSATRPCRRPSAAPTWRSPHGDSDGMRHLRALADAGLNTVHLLPAFDIATIEERRAGPGRPRRATSRRYAPDSEEQQDCVDAVRARGRLQLGLRPAALHGARGLLRDRPRGHRAARVEFRRMVQGLNGAGLQVVMDVVYNHTAASRPGRRVGARPDRARLLPPARRHAARSRPRRAAPTPRPSTR